MPGLAALLKQRCQLAAPEMPANSRDIQRRACAGGRLHDKKLSVAAANLNLTLSP